MERSSKVASRALIANSNNDALLLLKRLETDSEGGKWIAPGGTLNPGESPEAAIAREVPEETGLELDGAKHFTDELDENGWLTHFYMGEVRGELVIDPTESSEGRYFNAHELQAISIAFGHFPVYQAFLDGLAANKSTLLGVKGAV